MSTTTVPAADSRTAQSSSRLVRSFRRLATVTAAFITLLVTVAGPAQAGSWVNVWQNGTIYGYGTGTVYQKWNGVQANGFVNDVGPADGRCVRVYVRGYDMLLGYTGAKLEGTACGTGSSAYWLSDTYTAYSGRLEMKVCAGYIGGVCSPWTRVMS
jgi:hypothetical protein